MMNSECGISNQKEQDTNQICLEDDFLPHLVHTGFKMVCEFRIVL
jgi:hypothetical protein